jgi:hypothetical protein
MSVDRLRELLDAAVKLELATIPPYLCALYSIHPQGNDDAKLVIRSVVVEEMLHMVLAANVLNAIGGTPRVSGAENAPRYPHELPEGVVLHLLPFSPAAIDGFLAVENPTHHADHASADPEHPVPPDRCHETHVAHSTKTTADKPKTIGAFYAEIEQLLRETAHEIGEQALFCGDPARQVSREYYYAGGGRALEVTDLASATRALDEVVDQGEGDMGSMFDGDGDLAHYYRFQQLKHDRAYVTSDTDVPTGPELDVDFGSVHPMIENPSADEYADPDLRAANDAANRTWSELLVQIDEAFDGDPSALIPAVHSMFRLRDRMLVLLANPLPDHPGRTAGPTFDWVQP